MGLGEYRIEKGVGISNLTIVYFTMEMVKTVGLIIPSVFIWLMVPLIATHCH